MATSDKLLRRWRGKLVDASTSTRSKSVRSQWLGTLYIRLYRFLLSVYGPDGWGRTASVEKSELPLERDTESAGDLADRRTDPMVRRHESSFVDNSSEHRPTKLRSIDAIRGVLDRIHEDVGEAAPQKPAFDSTAKPGWLIVATSREISLRKCRRILGRADIEYRTRWFANYSALEVPQKQFDESIGFIRDNYRSLKKKRGQPSFIIAWVVGIGFMGPVTLSIWGARIFHSVEMATHSSTILATFCALTAVTVCTWLVVFKRILNA